LIGGQCSAQFPAADALIILLLQAQQHLAGVPQVF
jgi:hypothetical protein